MRSSDEAVAPLEEVFLDLGHLTGLLEDKVSTDANVVLCKKGKKDVRCGESGQVKSRTGRQRCKKEK